MSIICLVLDGSIRYLEGAMMTTDQTLVTIITKKIGAMPKKILYNTHGNVIELNLGDLGLSHLPGALWQLTQLRKLYLMRNRLTVIPSEIGHLTNLVSL